MKKQQDKIVQFLQICNSRHLNLNKLLKGQFEGARIHKINQKAESKAIKKEGSPK